ncbi:hypothetical protein SESBI_50414 [Sesbania bispinosa]|nr:hypothetical protein SESBI_50414 [Sesbania bispinosa]
MKGNHIKTSRILPDKKLRAKLRINSIKRKNSLASLSSHIAQGNRIHCKRRIRSSTQFKLLLMMIKQYEAT